MNKKLPARALFYAVVVSVFVALISSALLLGSYHQHLLMGYYKTQKKLLYNCQSGVELLLGSKEDNIDEIFIDLFDKQRDSISVFQKSWGLLEVGGVTAWARQGLYKDSVSKSFFIGKKPVNYALMLAEGTDALFVCGNTKIVGDVFLPREGVERGFIQGKPYQGQKLINGKIDIVKIIDNHFLKKRFEELTVLKNSEANFFLESDSAIQNFGQNTVVIVENNFNTANLTLKGNVLIVAKKSIEIDASSIVEDVLFLAPQIIIKTGFQGSLQAFAWDSLVVEQDVQLNYPSILGLLPREQKTDFSPTLRIQAFSQITGAIVVPNFIYNEYKSKAQIEQDAIVIGQVWVNGVLQHNGTVLGSIFCEEFLLKTAAAVYENYLLDAVIDRSKLSNFYLAPSLLSEISNKAILKDLK